MSVLKEFGEIKVLIRGAGDIASGIGHRLFKSGFKVFMTEVSKPTCIRRRVAFSEAVYEGRTEVEGVTSVLAKDTEEAINISVKGLIPILIDPETTCIDTLKPFALVDATLTKENSGISKEMAPIVIGVGPGFHAEVDCHAVVETMRGHNLGKVITDGQAENNTGIPGNIIGFSRERVIYSPVSGIIRLIYDIGDMVKEGETIAKINDTPLKSPIGGVLRGIIRDGFDVTMGMKIGDVDPRGVAENCFTISDKARAVGGGVLEAILYLSPTGLY